MIDEPKEPAGEEDDGFFLTGQVLIQAGMSPDGELQWRWKRDGIEPALALGFVDVIAEELRAEIRESIRETEHDEEEDD